MEPIDGTSPDLRARSVKVQEVNGVPWTLSCLSRGRGDEVVVDLAGDVALEAADDLALREPFGFPSRGVGAGTRTEAEARDRGEVEGAIGLPVATAIEPVALRHAGTRGERRHAAEHREAGLAAQPLRVVTSGDEQLAGDLDADPDLVEQLRVELADELLDRLVQIRDLVVELDDPTSDALERDPGRYHGIV